MVNLLLQALYYNGWLKPTTVQAHGLQHALASDAPSMIISAGNVRGKSILAAAVALAKVDCSLDLPQVIIATPSAEAAASTAALIRDLAQFMPPVRIGLAVGSGKPLHSPIGGGANSTRPLMTGSAGLASCHILVGTIAKLHELVVAHLALSHVSYSAGSQINSSRVKVLILDDCDEMLGGDSAGEAGTVLRRIKEALPITTQTIILGKPDSVLDSQSTSASSALSSSIAHSRSYLAASHGGYSSSVRSQLQSRFAGGFDAVDDRIDGVHRLLAILTDARPGREPIRIVVKPSSDIDSLLSASRGSPLKGSSSSSGSRGITGLLRSRTSPSAPAAAVRTSPAPLNGSRSGLLQAWSPPTTALSSFRAQLSSSSSSPVVPVSALSTSGPRSSLGGRLQDQFSASSPPVSPVTQARQPHWSARESVPGSGTSASHSLRRLHNARNGMLDVDAVDVLDHAGVELHQSRALDIRDLQMQLGNSTSAAAAVPARSQAPKAPISPPARVKSSVVSTVTMATAAAVPAKSASASSPPLATARHVQPAPIASPAPAPLLQGPSSIASPTASPSSASVMRPRTSATQAPGMFAAADRLVHSLSPAISSNGVSQPMINHARAVVTDSVARPLLPATAHGHRVQPVPARADAPPSIAVPQVHWSSTNGAFEFGSTTALPSSTSQAQPQQLPTSAQKSAPSHAVPSISPSASPSTAYSAAGPAQASTASNIPDVPPAVLDREQDEEAVRAILCEATAFGRASFASSSTGAASGAGALPAQATNRGAAAAGPGSAVDRAASSSALSAFYRKHNPAAGITLQRADDIAQRFGDIVWTLLSMRYGPEAVAPFQQQWLELRGRNASVVEGLSQEKHEAQPVLASPSSSPHRPTSGVGSVAMLMRASIANSIPSPTSASSARKPEFKLPVPIIGEVGARVSITFSKSPFDTMSFAIVNNSALSDSFCAPIGAVVVTGVSHTSPGRGAVAVGSQLLAIGGESILESHPSEALAKLGNTSLPAILKFAVPATLPPGAAGAGSPVRRQRAQSSESGTSSADCT